MWDDIALGDCMSRDPLGTLFLKANLSDEFSVLYLGSFYSPWNSFPRVSVEMTKLVYYSPRENTDLSATVPLPLESLKWKFLMHPYGGRMTILVCFIFSYSTVCYILIEKEQNSIYLLCG